MHYSLRLKAGDFFVISGSDLAAPLITEVYREALKAGAHPLVVAELPGLQEIFLKHAGEDQLKFISPAQRVVMEQSDAYLTIWGSHNTKALAGVDAKKMAARSNYTRELSVAFLRRGAEGKVRWCGTQFPTHADAQEAGMSLAEYEDFVFAAGLLDRDDPAAEWRRVSARQAKAASFLESKKEFHVVSRDTDLRLRADGRRWINCDGKENFPDGEVFTTPLRDSVEGTIRFSFPGIYYGKEVEDITLTFEQGKVTRASAAKGEDLLLALLDTDEGSRHVGEFAIGTNQGIQRFTHNTLFDEKIGGTVHLAVGAALEETGGKNESGIHWDMICDLRDGGRIYADGELIYQDGRFTREF